MCSFLFLLLSGKEDEAEPSEMVMGLVGGMPVPGSSQQAARAPLALFPNELVEHQSASMMMIKLTTLATSP